MKFNADNVKTTVAGLVVVLLGAVAASPIDQPFSKSVHDWALFFMAVAAGLGFHAAADAIPKIPGVNIKPEVKVDLPDVNINLPIPGLHKDEAKENK